jgi:hypothetical protein
MAVRMVVTVSVLILSSSRGKPVMENKAYAKCARINLIMAKLAFARFYEAWATLKCHFSSNSQVENQEIPKIGTPDILEAHNFLCRPPIEVRFKTKL